MKKELETFQELGVFGLRELSQKEPSCWNGNVRVIKYKITIEEIEEPVEVIQARIHKLWNECDNHHHRSPLKLIAKKYGLDL